MAVNLNHVVLTGNLSADPELRSTDARELCALRVACNTRRRSEAGEWLDKPNYFSVTVWGPQGASCARYLRKGSPVAVDGRLEWREWDPGDGGSKRQAVEIVAERVQFLGGTGGGPPSAPDVPAPVGADEEIPF